jgi:pyruvate ferredoxin oxidoreductase delta subunit
MICPESCVRRTEDDHFEPDYEFCKGCGLCAKECPAKGIEMEKEEK